MQLSHFFSKVFPHHVVKVTNVDSVDLRSFHIFCMMQLCYFVIMYIMSVYCHGVPGIVFFVHIVHQLLVCSVL
jgi:hypothetical protein